MLWSLLKILAFVAAIIALTYSGTLLMEVQGSAVITIAGREMTFSPMKMVIGLMLLVLAVWLLLKALGFLVALVRFINGDETAVSRYFSRNRERRGFDALSDGMVALASGEGQLALTKAARAERLLGRPELTNLLAAQAAEMAGDSKKAEETYRQLLEDDRTRFVGVRGIMKQRLAEGDTDTALALAKKAFELKPRHDETLDVLLKLQAGSQDWQGARQTLGAKLKNGALPRDVFKRRDAVLALSAAQATAQNSDGENTEAATKAMQEAAIEAHRQSPDLVPAAVLAAHSYVQSGSKRHATRALRKAWDSHPHPDLAAAFAAIEPEEEATARIKRFGLLTKGKPDHAETKMLMAELQIVAEDFPAAERALGDLVETDPTARVLTLMAAIERGKGADDSVVRGWLTKALTAPRGPQWICNNCQHIHVNWEPVCTQCQGFDTLAWRAPDSNDVAMPSGTEMLPLITGAPEPIVSEAEADSAEDDADTITIEANN